MKTTIEIGDALLSAAKALAQKRGTTLKAIVEEGLRHVIAERESESESFRLRDASFEGNGLQPEFRDAAWEEIRREAYHGRGG